MSKVIIFIGKKQMVKIHKTYEFEWRLSPEELGSLYFAIAIRKFEPWRKRLNDFVLKIMQGHLLAPTKAFKLIPNNRNPFE